jgi:hypothetical protein
MQVLNSPAQTGLRRSPAYARISAAFAAKSLVLGGSIGPPYLGPPEQYG